VKGTIWKELRS